MKLLLCILFVKYINILALEMVRPVKNPHCTSCISALSLPVKHQQADTSDRR